MPQTIMSNGYSNGHIGYEMEEDSVFLFTSESVGEGHPGRFRLIFLFIIRRWRCLIRPGTMRISFVLTTIYFRRKCIVVLPKYSAFPISHADGIMPCLEKCTITTDHLVLAPKTRGHRLLTGTALNGPKTTLFTPFVYLLCVFCKNIVRFRI